MRWTCVVVNRGLRGPSLAGRLAAAAVAVGARVLLQAASDPAQVFRLLILGYFSLTPQEFSLQIDF